MQIGKPLRIVIVEPLELPVSDPTGEPSTDPPASQPEPAPTCIRWDRQYMRWETSPLACIETKANARAL